MKPTNKPARKDAFLTLRVTPEFRDSLSLIADAESRSMSAQALHLIKSGMQMYLQQKTRQSASKAP
jgi:hypothetical protein